MFCECPIAVGQLMFRLVYRHKAVELSPVLKGHSTLSPADGSHTKLNCTPVLKGHCN